MSVSPIRLLQVMLAPGNGGAETFFEKLAMAFQEAGIEQKLVICRHPERRRRLEAAGCEVVEIPAQGWRKWLARGKVRRISEAYAPTVQLAWMSRAAASLPRRRGCINLARLGGYYPLKYYRHCDHLIGNTPGVLEYLEQAGWPAERLSLVSNFGEIPSEDAEDAVRDLRKEFSIPEGLKVAVTLGRLHPNKAQDVLIRALAEVPDLALLIAGEGPLRSELEALVESCGVADRMRFLGWWRDTRSLFAAADLCVFPSRAEPLGNVVLEAWAFGVPIAAAASEGPSWLIEDGEQGLLFPVDDVEACGAATRRLLEDSALAKQCALGGRRKWLKAFSKPAIVGQYQQLFERLLSEG